MPKPATESAVFDTPKPRKHFYQNWQQNQFYWFSIP